VRKGVDRSMEFLKKEYKHVFELIFRYPKTTIAVVILVFLGSLMLARYIENDFIPKSDED